MDMQANGRLDAQMQADAARNVTSYRPNQVLLLGLGGVGSRVVDRIMRQVPEEYRPYTQAVSIDTNVNDLKKLKNIPEQNHIQLGSNITIGGYLRNHPEVGEWLVQGKQLDLLRKRNTKNGAKQIRMISRIALRSTHEQGHLGKRIAAAINKINSADGKTDGNGLMVLVVCSIAGGTGAGTVIQVPMYLEEAIKDAYNIDKVQFECAMMMPNAFATTLSTDNYKNAKVNAYAVLRELMSLNTGRLRRFEYFDAHEVDTTDERIAPYGRVMFFDGQNVKGEAITGDVDTVHVPLMADALSEYLFGPASGKIVGALDNTLNALYSSNGRCVFGAVGKAELAYPRMLYKQYAIANWITSTISETWLFPDEEADKTYREAVQTARKEGREKPQEDVAKPRFYRKAVEKASNPFFKEIRLQLAAGSTNADTGVETDCAQAFWDDLCEYAINDLIVSSEKIGMAKARTAEDIANIDSKNTAEGRSAVKAQLDTLCKAFDEAERGIGTVVRDLMQPTGARNSTFYTKDKTAYRLNTFVKEHNLHPIGLRCFLYELFELVKEDASDVKIGRADSFVDSDWASLLTKSKERGIHIADQIADFESQYKSRFRAEIAKLVLVCLKEYIQEVEDLFTSVRKVKEFYQSSIRMCESKIDQLSRRADTTIVGSTLSMVNCWALLKNNLHAGEEEDDIIDNELSKELNKLVYQGYFRHIDDNAQASVVIDGDVYRIPTDYVKVLQTSLQRHFMNKIDTTYRNFFPADIVEAVQYDCGVKNFFNIQKHHNPHLSANAFVCASPLSPDHYETAKNMGIKAFDPVDVFNKLLAVATRKSEPRCGMLVEGAGEGYIYHYAVMNPAILRVMKGTDDMDEEIMSQQKDESQIIEGVSTSTVEGIDITACFEGKSVDKITFVSTYAALEPFDFAALLAPDSDPNAPQDAMNYYRAYREYINEVVTNPSTITPHLDRRWHLADKLADITESHTDSVRKHAAKAFVYGFAYDTISVKDGGTVEFGKSTADVFKRIGPNGIVKADFITAAEQAEIYAVSSEEAKQKLDSVLNSIFERLVTDPELTTALIDYAEERLAAERKFSNAGEDSFLKLIMTTEHVANTNYRSILDVIDGFYNGSVRAEHIDADFAEDSARYMFEILVSTIFEQASTLAQAAADVKKLACGIVNVLYGRAICDDSPKDDPKAKTAAKDLDITDLAEGEDAFAAMDALLGEVRSPAQSAAVRKPFTSPHGDFRLEKAYEIIDQLLRERK